MPVEEVQRCPSVPRRFRRPQPQLGNSETKVLASNCLLSKAQPASSATGVRGKLMSGRGRGAGRPFTRPVLPWQTGLSPLADGHGHPPSPSALWLSARFSSGWFLPRPGQCGASWVQLGPRLRVLGVPFPLAGPPTPRLYNRSLGRSHFECPSCSNCPQWGISGGGTLQGRVSLLRYY